MSRPSIYIFALSCHNIASGIRKTPPLVALEFSDLSNWQIINYANKWKIAKYNIWSKLSGPLQSIAKSATSFWTFRWAFCVHSPSKQGQCVCPRVLNMTKINKTLAILPIDKKRTVSFGNIASSIEFFILVFVDHEGCGCLPEFINELLKIENWINTKKIISEKNR